MLRIAAQRPTAGSAVAVHGLQVAQLCRAAVEVGLVLGLELELELGLG
jgi:hypothetical protein